MGRGYGQVRRAASLSGPKRHFHADALARRPSARPPIPFLSATHLLVKSSSPFGESTGVKEIDALSAVASTPTKNPTSSPRLAHQSRSQGIPLGVAAKYQEMAIIFHGEIHEPSLIHVAFSGRVLLGVVTWGVRRSDPTE